MKTSKKKTAKKTPAVSTKGVPPKDARASQWSHGDTNEAIGRANEPYGTPAFNLYYTIDSLPPMVRDAFSDTLSDLAKRLDVDDPTATDGEVLGFRRLVKLCKAAAAQEDGEQE